jgi:class 3 adenylate cyclase
VTDLHQPPSIDDLLDRGVAALNSGDRAAADALASQVLAVDEHNPDAEGLLSAPWDSGEIRRLTMLFADLVDSTALSTQVEPEVYRMVVGGYRDKVLDIVASFEGHVANTKGDGIFAVFGHPRAHENDAQRAVQTGLEITRAVATFSEQVRHRFGFEIDVRVGIHRGLVYLDRAEDDVYGLGANLAARMCGLAEPGSVRVSAAIERVARDEYVFAERPSASVKGVDGPVVSFYVASERDAVAVSRGPLIGRDHELAYLADRWSRVTARTADSPGIVLRGEGGIGKTRLVSAIKDIAERDGAAVLAMFGSPFHTTIGLRPVRRMIEQRCDIGRDSDPTESLRKLDGELRSRAIDPEVAVPLLAPVLGLTPGPGYHPPTANAGRLHDQINHAVKDYLLACVGDGPGLIVFEDMHWFDEDTLEIAAAMLASRGEQLLVVATGRQIPELAGGPAIVDLKPLADDESEALIRALNRELEDTARQAVRLRCDGIPLYIEEVVARLRTEGDEAAQVPDTLYEALVARLRSNPAMGAVLEAAALIGSRFDETLLSAVIGVDAAQVGAQLDELQRDRVLRHVDARNWRFHHELMREVAAELAPPSVRRRLHKSIADALTRGAAEGTPEWTLVAHHFEEAELFDDAATSFRRASTDARQRGALNEARSHLSRALENLHRMPATRDRDHREVTLRLERGVLASAASGHGSTEAAAEFERCLELIGNEPSTELYATFTPLWSYYTTRGNLARATRLVQALRLRLNDMPSWHRITNDAVVGALAMLRGEFHSARLTLAGAVAALDDADTEAVEHVWFTPNDPLAGLATMYGFVSFLQGDLRAAEDTYRKIRDRCAQIGFPHGPFSLCYAQGIEALVRIEAGQLDRAAELAAELGKTAEKYGFDEWVLIARCIPVSLASRTALSDRAASTDAWEGHIAASTAIVEGWRAAETKSMMAPYDGVLAGVLTAAGRRREARERVEEAMRIADETGMRYYDAEFMRLRAHTYDDAADTHNELLAAAAVARHQGALVFEMRCVADIYKLVGESARSDLADVLSRFPPGQSWPELERARALLA